MPDEVTVTLSRQQWQALIEAVPEGAMTYMALAAIAAIRRSLSPDGGDAEA